MITYDDEGVLIDFRVQIPDAPRTVRSDKEVAEMIRNHNAKVEEQRRKEIEEDLLKWREAHKRKEE